MGKTFCITGKLSKPRKDFEKIIKENNGKYTSVNKNLNFLIIGDGAKDHKITKAQSFGTKILTEQEFWDLIE